MDMLFYFTKPFKNNAFPPAYYGDVSLEKSENIKSYKEAN